MNSCGAIELKDEHDSQEMERETESTEEENLYRNRLISVYENLIDYRNELFSDALNMAMAGDMKEIDHRFGTVDSFTFSIEHIDDSKDINVRKTLALLEQLEDTMDSLANINVIKESELK